MGECFSSEYFWIAHWRLEAERTSLWAAMCCWSSLTSVTSKKSCSLLKLLNVLDMFDWKQFHFKQNLSIFLLLLVCSLKLFHNEFTQMECWPTEVKNSFQINRFLNLIETIFYMLMFNVFGCKSSHISRNVR